MNSPHIQAPGWLKINLVLSGLASSLRTYVFSCLFVILFRFNFSLASIEIDLNQITSEISY